MALQSHDLARLRGVGVTNQRETTILWDKVTGESLAPAVVWCDGRTGQLVERMIAKTPSKNKDDLRVQGGGARLLGMLSEELFHYRLAVVSPYTRTSVL